MIIGVIPAGGKAERMGGSYKFLMPCKGHKSLLHKIMHDMLLEVDRVVILPSLDNFPLIKAAVEQDFDQSRWVIARVFGDSPTEAVGKLVNNIKPYSDNQVVQRFVLGMPDTYFEDHRIFSKILNELDLVMSTRMVVGSWETDPRWLGKRGVIRLADTVVDGPPVVAKVDDKPNLISKRNGPAWGVIGWKSGVSHLVHADGSTSLSDFINRVAEGYSFSVRSVQASGKYFDLGTLDEMQEAYKYMGRL